MATERVLIVGGVAGGASCATRLRRLDEQAEIVIFERGPHVSFANCGLPYYVGGVIRERQQLLVASPERFRDFFRIDVRPRHDVMRIDRQRQSISVRDLETGQIAEEPYDYLVLSPGAAPIRPPVPGNDLPGIYSLRNLEDMDRIHEAVAAQGAQRAVVIGGGYIGLEMTENLVARGLQVTILELRDRIMAVMDPEMTQPIIEELARHGVELRLNEGLAGLQPGAAGGLMVDTTAGNQLPADLVILAIGVRPEADLAQHAGLEIGQRGGIRVDDQMRTSDPRILALGDAVETKNWITGQYGLVPLAGPANRQGRVAADVIAGRASGFRGVQGTGIVGLFGWTLALTGANESALQQAGMPYRKSYTHWKQHAGYYPGAESIALKLLFAPDSGRLLGAQAVGREGVDKRIDVIAMALQMRGTVYDLEEAELCYAPQYGSARDAVNIAGMVAANSLRGDLQLAHWEDWQTQKERPDAPLVVDVRPPDAAGAVPGAIKIPLPELRSRLDELPRDREIWVHCAIGQTSYLASRILQQHGYRVRSLSGGMTSYQAWNRGGC